MPSDLSQDDANHVSATLWVGSRPIQDEELWMLAARDVVLGPEVAAGMRLDDETRGLPLQIAAYQKRGGTFANVRGAQFACLVLCAEELQIPAHHFPGVEVLSCPLDDNFDRMPPGDEQRALATAARIGRRLAQGQAVLSTCQQGRNRSSLVAALALVLRSVPAERAIRLVRAARGPGALANPQFVACIERAGQRQKRTA